MIWVQSVKSRFQDKITVQLVYNEQGYIEFTDITNCL